MNMMPHAFVLAGPSESSRSEPFLREITLYSGSTLVRPAFFVAQVCIVPCPCYQSIHWPVHPCPNYLTIYQHMFPRRNICCRAYQHNVNAMLSIANMRQYRPCHAFPTLFEARVKEHVLQKPGLRPQSRPAAALACGNQEHRPRRNSSFFCVFLRRISS